MGREGALLVCSANTSFLSDHDNAGFASSPNTLVIGCGFESALIKPQQSNSSVLHHTPPIYSLQPIGLSLNYYHNNFFLPSKNIFFLFFIFLFLDMRGRERVFCHTNYYYYTYN